MLRRGFFFMTMLVMIAMGSTFGTVISVALLEFIAGRQTP